MSVGRSLFKQLSGRALAKRALLPRVDIRKLTAFSEMTFPVPMEQDLTRSLGHWVDITKNWPGWATSPYLIWRNSFGLIEFPEFDIECPKGELVFPRDVTLYEDYRIQQAEDIALGVEHKPEFESIDIERRQRGMAMAWDPRIRQVRSGIWSVPSGQSYVKARLGRHRRPSDSKPVTSYEVDARRRTCTCPDFERRRLKCKHIYAIEHLSVYSSFSVGIDYAAKDAEFTKSIFAKMGQELMQFGTTTGRLSSSKPNQCGVPRPDLGPVDYAALETRIAAAIGIPRSFLQSDIHDAVALTLEVKQPATVAMDFALTYEEP